MGIGLSRDPIHERVRRSPQWPPVGCSIADGDGVAMRLTPTGILGYIGALCQEQGGWSVAVTDDAIEHIKAMIVSGELKPGDRLPPEAELASTLGVSRNSLREAVRALALVHILDVRQGDGTYVTSLEPHLLLDALTFIVDFHRDDSVLQFLEVRRELESAAAARAARNITPEQIKELRRVNEATSDSSSIDDLVANDLLFHRLIGEASCNVVLASLIENISAPTTRARVWRGLTQGGSVQRTIEEHSLIIEAIEAGDGDLARARAAVHVAGVEDWLRRAR